MPSTKYRSTAIAAMAIFAGIGVTASARSPRPSSGAASAVVDPQPGLVLQTSATYSFIVGDVRVTALSDGTVPIDLHALLRGATTARIDGLLRRSFLTNPAEASINAFLLEIGDRSVLVDTGAGDLFGPGNGGRLVQSLARAGIDPARVDDILITHVHTDHSGGLFKDGRMVFANATVHVGRPDLEFFLDPMNARRTGYDARYFVEAAKTLKPYAKAGRVKPFDGRSRILPGITAEVRPGHTPGSAFYTLESRGERITFIGDVIHVAAVQFPDPAITITFDLDQRRAARVRALAFADFARTRTLIAAPHLPFPGVGRIRPSGAGYDWVPIAYGDRLVAAAR